MRHLIDASSDLAMNTLDAGPRVDETEVTFDIPGLWLESTMGEFRDVRWASWQS